MFAIAWFWVRWMVEVPEETAVKLCEEIQVENLKKFPLNYGRMWCWGCRTFTKGEAGKMCWANDAGNRGCGQINERYDNKEESGNP